MFKIFKLIWQNLGWAIVAAFFGSALSLVVSGEHIGQAVFWVNVVLVWIVFTIIDIVKMFIERKSNNGY
jgi:hypothetical protein